MLKSLQNLVSSAVSALNLFESPPKLPTAIKGNLLPVYNDHLNDTVNNRAKMAGHFGALLLRQNYIKEYPGQNGSQSFKGCSKIKERTYTFKKDGVTTVARKKFSDKKFTRNCYGRNWQVDPNWESMRDIYRSSMGYKSGSKPKKYSDMTYKQFFNLMDKRKLEVQNERNYGPISKDDVRVKIEKELKELIRIENRLQSIGIKKENILAGLD